MASIGSADYDIQCACGLTSSDTSRRVNKVEDARIEVPMHDSMLSFVSLLCQIMGDKTINGAFHCLRSKPLTA